MLSKNWVLQILLFIAIVVYIVFGYNWSKVEISLDIDSYNIGENIKIKITNNLSENICFSSCYPYYLEFKTENNNWEKYKYKDCPEEDIAEKCINYRETKFFELLSKKHQTGIHRISIPVCVDCEEGEKFEKDKEFYSIEFEVN